LSERLDNDQSNIILVSAAVSEPFLVFKDFLYDFSRAQVVVLAYTILEPLFSVGFVAGVTRFP
jgi:hypothetical protein